MVEILLRSLIVRTINNFLALATGAITLHMMKHIKPSVSTNRVCLAQFHWKRSITGGGGLVQGYEVKVRSEDKDLAT